MLKVINMGQFIRSGCRLMTVCLVLASVCLARQEQTVKSVNWLESAKNDLWHLPKDVLDSSRDTFLRNDNIAALLLAGRASVVMHNDGADKDIADDFEHHRRFSGRADETVYIAGGPGLHFAATGIWYIISVESQSEINKSRSWTMMKALSITGLTERPYVQLIYGRFGAG